MVARYLLDTSILHQLIAPDSPPALAAWLDAQDNQDLYICSMNLAEIWNSILQLAAGEKSADPKSWLAVERARRVIFSGRVLNFDDKAGEVWARLMSQRSQAGLPCTPVDMIYAAITEANGCILVTDNEERFTGLDVLNPIKI